MGTFVVYTVVGAKTVTIALAQDSRGTLGAGQSPGQVPTLPVRRFDIPPGLLDAALNAFQAATRLRVQTANEGIRSLSSPGVRGVFPVEQALRQLLANTGATYRFTADGTVTIELQNVATTVEVTDTASALATSTPKYSEPLRNTPQSISVVPRQVMEAQGAMTLRDTLRNVAGISIAAGEGGSQGDNLTIRGFTARNDLFIDGMRDFGSYYRDPFNLEEVQVLQGPSSVTFGRGSTGGVVNQASKTAQLKHAMSGDVNFGSDRTRRVTFDFNSPVPKLGDGAAFRLNIMGAEGNVAGRDIAENRRFGVAPTLSVGLGTTTRLTLSYLHQTANDIPDYGVPWLFNGPAPVNRANYYGFRKGNFLRTYDDIGTARVEHEFNSKVSLRNQVRYANYVRNVQITEPQVLNPSLSTPLSELTINRNQLSAYSTETYLVEQLDLTVRFQTGFIQHNLIAGVEAGRETSDPVRPRYTNVPTTSLLDPNPDQTFTGIPAPSTNVQASATTASAYVLDTAKLGRKWELSGGVRWDRFDADYKQSVTPAAAFTRVDRMAAWRTALVYKPVPIGSIYFGAGTSFNPSAESLALSAATANLPPEKNKTYELGTKWDVSGGKLSLRTALFRTEKTNAREPDPDNPLLNVLAGAQRVDGAQVEARGQLTRRWELLTSYAHLNAKLVSSNFYPAAIGARLANVPENTFNFWSNYRLPRRWEIGTGANVVSSRTASSTVPLDPTTQLVKQVPGYWVFNAMASHSLNEHVSLQVNAYNLANRYYYDQLHPGHIVLGPGRSVLASIKFKF